MGNIKLPNPYLLRRHLTDGMSLAQIAERYGCSRVTVRDRITRSGLRSLIPAMEMNRPPTKSFPVDKKVGVEIHDHKIVFTTEVTTNGGGTNKRSISVSRISMQAEVLREAGRC